MAEVITVVPSVKAYPALLSGLQEAVCVAGFRTGVLVQPSWVRLFPVPFRELDETAQFRKWQEITVQVERPKNDRRPESFLPLQGTIRAGRQLPALERQMIVNTMPHVSTCGLMAEQRSAATSLGVVRPRKVIDVLVELRDLDEVRAQQRRVDAAASQQRLFGPALTPLEVIPHRFAYRYLCENPECGEHRQGIVDWEISAAYRSWRHSYPSDFIERVRQKWLTELCGADRDTRLFVGNMHQYPQSFLVVGVFAPKRYR